MAEGGPTLTIALQGIDRLVRELNRALVAGTPACPAHCHSSRSGGEAHRVAPTGPVSSPACDGGTQPRAFHCGQSYSVDAAAKDKTYSESVSSVPAPTVSASSARRPLSVSMRLLWSGLRRRELFLGPCPVCRTPPILPSLGFAAAGQSYRSDHARERSCACRPPITAGFSRTRRQSALWCTACAPRSR